MAKSNFMLGQIFGNLQNVNISYEEKTNILCELTDIEMVNMFNNAFNLEYCYIGKKLSLDEFQNMHNQMETMFDWLFELLQNGRYACYSYRFFKNFLLCIIRNFSNYEKKETYNKFKNILKKNSYCFPLYLSIETIEKINEFNDIIFQLCGYSPYYRTGINFEIKDLTHKKCHWIVKNRYQIFYKIERYVSKILSPEMLVSKSLPFWHYCIYPLLESGNLQLKSLKMVNRHYNNVFSHLDVKIIDYKLTRLHRRILMTTIHMGEFESCIIYNKYYSNDNSQIDISKEDVFRTIEKLLVDNDYYNRKRKIKNEIEERQERQEDELWKELNLKNDIHSNIQRHELEERILHPKIVIDLNNINKCIIKSEDEIYCGDFGSMPIYASKRNIMDPDFDCDPESRYTNFDGPIVTLNNCEELRSLVLNDISSLPISSFPYHNNIFFLEINKIDDNILSSFPNLRYLKAKYIGLCNPFFKHNCLEYIKGETIVFNEQNNPFPNLKKLQMCIYNFYTEKDEFLIYTLGWEIPLNIYFPNLQLLKIITPEKNIKKEKQILNSLIIHANNLNNLKIKIRRFHMIDIIINKKNFFEILEKILNIDVFTNIYRIQYHASAYECNMSIFENYKNLLKTQFESFVQKFPSQNIISNFEFKKLLL